MLWLFPVLFVLFIIFFIGWYIGQSVPDEIVPSKAYLRLGMDLLLLLIIAFAIASFGQVILALCVVAALILARVFFPTRFAYAPLSGIVLGTTVLLSSDAAVSLLILTSLLNFLVGATSGGRRELLLHALWQPVCAILVWFVISLL